MSYRTERPRKNPMYGNENGLPGLPRTTYVTVGGRRVRPQPPRTQAKPVAPPAPMKTNRPPAPVYRQPPTQPMMPSMPSGPDPTLSRRIDTLDMRLNSTEQSNRTLLDELMRLQQEIKSNVRKNEMAIQEERDSRNRLEMSIRQSSTKSQEVDDRIRRCEEAVKDNRATLQQLSVHVKNVENMVTSLQQENTDKKNEISSKHQEYRNEMGRITGETEGINRMLGSVREEARGSGKRIDHLQDEIAALQRNLQTQAKILEDVANKPVPVPKTPAPAGVDKNIFDNETQTTKKQMTEFNSALQELSNRVSSESSSRKKAEEDFNNKFNKLFGDMSTSKLDGESKQKEYDDKMKQMQLGFAESDKQQIRMELSRVSNELNKKIDANDAKLRDDTVNKLTVIEKTLMDEKKGREDRDKKLEEDLRKGMDDVKLRGESDSNTLKTTLDKQVVENKEKLSSLNKRMNDVEQSFREHKLEQERLINAEIEERLKSDKILDAKIDDLEDDVQLGFKTIQREIGDQSTKKGSKTSKAAPLPPSLNMDEVSRMQEDTSKGIREHVTKEMGSLEKRVSDVEMELKQRNDVFDNQLRTTRAEDSEKTTLMGDQMQQQIDAVVFKHNKLKKKVDDLEKDVSTTPNNLQSFKDETSESLREMKQEIDREEKERKKDVKELNDSLDRIVGSENHSSVTSLTQLNTEVDQTQTGLKKCAESIHVVKTMLTDKLKDESRIREKECSILETDVERLETKIKELKERIKNSSGDPDPDDTITDFDDYM